MERNDDIKTWFRQQVLDRRIIGCIMYSVVLQTILSVAIIFLLNCNLTVPLQSFKDGSSALFSLSTIACLFILSVVTSTLVLCISTNYSMHPTIFSTQLERILHFFKLWRHLMVTGYAAIAAIVAVIYLRVAGIPYYALSVSCADDGDDEANLCLNRRYVLLVSSAAFVGLLYGSERIYGSRGCVRFPFIQRTIYVQVKSELLSKIDESFHVVLSYLKWFLIVYAIASFRLENFLARCFGLHIGNSSFWTTASDLMDFKLWWSLLLVDTAIHLLLSGMAYLFSIFITEKFSFVIESIYESQVGHTLIEALGCVDCSLLRHFAFLDLSLSSQQSVTKRREIYSLSQPGGHPHRWNAILEICLKLVRDVTREIVAVCEPPPKTAESTEPSTKHIDSSSDAAYEMWRMQRFGYRLSPRNGHIVSPTLVPCSNIVPLEKRFAKVMKQKLGTLRNSFLNMPLVAYFFRESAETKFNKIFVSCQTHVWAIEALSFLVVASIKEDRYGVVQKDLPSILTSLQDLQQALQKLRKLEAALGPTRKATRITDSWPHQMKVLLNHAVDSAVNGIVFTFRSSLNSVAISSENRKNLSRYLERLE